MAGTEGVREETWTERDGTMVHDRLHQPGGQSELPGSHRKVLNKDMRIPNRFTLVTCNQLLPPTYCYQSPMGINKGSLAPCGHSFQGGGLVLGSSLALSW